MSDFLKYGNAIRLANLSADPSGPENGTLYYNTVSNVIRKYVNGGWVDDGSSVDVDDLITLTGVPANSTDLGTFSGAIIGDNETIKGALQDLETAIESLPDPLIYKGTWNASTNTPTLADGVGTNGFLYQVSVAGTVDFGSGPITFVVNDKVVYNGATWEKWDLTDAVLSVNGQTGIVVLTTSDIAEGSNLYFTDERAQDAVGTILVDSSKIDFTYNDAAPSITATIVAGSLVNADINVAAAIDASKLADGSVSNAELQFINSLTSNAQTQLDGKANTALSNLASVAINTSLLPASAASVNIGSNSLPFGTVNTRNIRNSETVITFTGDTTSGSAVITNISSTVGLHDQQNVVGSGIPEGSGIDSVDSATQITLDTNATATATGVTFRAVVYIDVRTSNHTGTDPTGMLFIKSGNSVNNNSGLISLRSGNSSGTGNSGSVTIGSGSSSGGTRGQLNLTASQINVDASVIPSASGKNLGSSGNKFANANLSNSLVLEDPGAGSNEVTIQAAAATAAYTLTLLSALPVSTQAVTISATGQLGSSAFSAASPGDIAESSYSGLANNTADQVITGFAFNNATVRSFKAQVSVVIDATTDLFTTYELMGIQRGSSWAMSESFTGDSIPSFTFTITNAGQVRATIGSVTGFSSGLIKFRATTTSV